MTNSENFSRFRLVLLLTTLLMFTAGCPGGKESALKLQDVAPDLVKVDGGETITLTGEAFAQGMKIWIDGLPCTSVQVKSETQATCIVPDHRVGDVAVAVESAGSDDFAIVENAMTYICGAPPSDGIAVWANSGEDKVTQDELRATCDPKHMNNSVWNGNRVRVWGAKNEVVAFNTIIEASSAPLSNVTVSFASLTGPGGYVIASAPASGNGVFDWTQRKIELFHVQYLQIKGLSVIAYQTYDERHIPERFRRPWTGTGAYDTDGKGVGTWEDRPDHDKFYPDIAVPLELVGGFNVAAKTNQSIWADVFIPKDAPAGTYTGTLTVKVSGATVRTIPVQLDVKNFTLPDEPSSKTMLFLGYEDVSMRYIGDEHPDDDPVLGPKVDLINDRHFQIAHRHKIAMVDSNKGWTIWTQQNPRPSWEPRLSGRLFTASMGYDGPGIGVGNKVYSIGTYGSWDWKGEFTDEDRSRMWQNTNEWESWFAANYPDTERFLYLKDEPQSAEYSMVETWARWMNENPGIGSNIPSFSTVPLDRAFSAIPSLDIFASFVTIENTLAWNNVVSQLPALGKKLFLYNAFRPGSGTFMIEDDGVALRELAWGQYKKQVSRWFYWQSTYYKDYQNSRGQIDVFQTGQTFGEIPQFDPVRGLTGANYGNGDGVLFYPGTDMVYPSRSYNVDGPFASLRLKYWRRGIQDVDYIELAKRTNPARVAELVQERVPSALWEVGQLSAGYVRANISWSTDPDAWEASREALADIISAGTPTASSTAALKSRLRSR